MSGAGGRGGRPVRLALVLSGGASLGSYVAGVLSELLGALMGEEGGGVTVQVIAGSSSGAVNAALAARALTVNPEVLPFLRRLWVEALDARWLLDADRPGRAGLLDDRAIHELGRALITAGPATDDRVAACVGDRLHLGLALSNLSGVPHPYRYAFRNAPDRSCGVRVHRDSITFQLRPPVAAADPVWERIRVSALASAAFPFAFPPVRITRPDTDYPGACFPEASSGSHEMWFADGGLFANEPIGLAKRLVESVPDYRSARWRYVLVDPDLSDHETRADPPASLDDVAGALTRAVLGQAAAQDWVRATETNVRVQLFEAIVARLPEIADGLCDPDALELGRHIGQLAEDVAEWQSARAGEGEDLALALLDAAIARIETDPRFRPVLARVSTRAARTRLAKLIFVLEAAGDLRDKQILPLYLVAPPADEPLAGTFLGSFGGFLDAKWRAHDFAAGRRDGARLLTRHFADVIDYRGDPEALAADLLETPSLSTSSREARDRLDEYVDRATARLLESMRPGLVAGALGWLWKPAVRRWVRRRAREVLG